MNSGSIFCVRLVAITFLLFSLVTAAKSQASSSLASVNIDLSVDSEVGLEIEARTPRGSWALHGSEAAALLISVDGVYNQDLLLWAGDEFFRYRVLLGRLAPGKHNISVALNPSRSAPKTKLAEVKDLRALPFLTGTSEDDSFAIAHAPFLYARANTIDRFTDIPLLMYYEILQQPPTDKIIRYTAIFTNEDGGTQTAALMARWGRATDIEWVFELRLRDGKIVEETFQGVEHETKVFSGSRVNGGHPILATASDNNNFSDLACSAVRFAPLPSRARLENATRESTMDPYPQAYRAMTDELTREKRIDGTRRDMNTIADPREYVYLEGSSEQIGAAIAFEVKVTGRTDTFSSDLGIDRLRIDRSGNYRTAIRLPRDVTPNLVERVTARCYATDAVVETRSCKNLRLLRVLMLGQTFVPREIPFQIQPPASLSPGDMKVFSR